MDSSRYRTLQQMDETNFYIEVVSVRTWRWAPVFVIALLSALAWAIVLIPVIVLIEI